MLLNIVTDEELLTSQIIKTIVLCLAGAGIIYTGIKIFRTESGKKRVFRSIFLLFLSAVIFFVFKEYRIEAALLGKPEYVQGTTTGYCSVFARGEGIEFEYELNGQKFRNCNTFHPLSKDSIVVPGGKYRVRYAAKFPGLGRMNFRLKAE